MWNCLIWANQIRCLERKDELQVSIFQAHGSGWWMFDTHQPWLVFFGWKAICTKRFVGICFLMGQSTQKQRLFFFQIKHINCKNHICQRGIVVYVLCILLFGYALCLGLTAWFECFNSLSKEWRDFHTYAMLFFMDAKEVGGNEFLSSVDGNSRKKVYNDAFRMASSKSSWINLFCLKMGKKNLAQKIGPSFLFYILPTPQSSGHWPTKHGHVDVFLLSPRNGRENCPDGWSQGPFEMELLELPEVFFGMVDDLSMEHGGDGKSLNVCTWVVISKISLF